MGERLFAISTIMYRRFTRMYRQTWNRHSWGHAPRPSRLPTDSEYAANQNIGEFGKEVSKAAFCIFFNFLESFFNFLEGCHKDRAFLNRLLIKQLIRFFSPNLKGLFAGKSKHWRFLFSASVLAQPFNF